MCAIPPVVGQAARGDPQIASLCDRAAIRAANKSHVPLDVLRAISRAETGRASSDGLQPWPWTVNMEGTGRWFATLDEARSYVFSHFKTGARSFDVGCFQINYKWHGNAFRSIDDMFDPQINADYAAKFLTELFGEFGNWRDAAGAYHSRTPKFATKYAARYGQIKAGLTDPSEIALTGQGGQGRLFDRESGAPRVSGPSPLTRGQVTLGSLVPITRQPSAPLRPLFIIK
ncbi:MAG: lytic transglycosylase domain-containing protein [Rhodobacteraceae bacterium]|nr:lytic transglycosylase domain-containing protein [Paracoccaceae bacterium]